MKVAVVITGLPRKVKEGYESCWKRYIENYDADVYVQYWDGYEDTIVKQTYPTAQKLQSHNIDFSKYTEGVSVTNKDFYNSFPLFYAWSSIVPFVGDYDVVIRGRFDLSVPLIDLSSADLNKFNVCNNWEGQLWPDDNFSISSTKLYKQIFQNIFTDLIQFSKINKELYFPERNLYEIMKLKKLDNLIVKHKFPLLILRDVNHTYTQ